MPGQVCCVSEVLIGMDLKGLLSIAEHIICRAINKSIRGVHLPLNAKALGKGAGFLHSGWFILIHEINIRLGGRLGQWLREI